MKRIVDNDEQPMEALLGEKITLLCAAYFYTGKLTGVNDFCVELTSPSIVYETGRWDEPKWADVQALPCETISVTRQSIEAFGVLK